MYIVLAARAGEVSIHIASKETSQLSLFHSETQDFWSILKVIPSNLTVKMASLTQNVEPNHPKL